MRVNFDCGAMFQFNVNGRCGQSNAYAVGWTITVSPVQSVFPQSDESASVCSILPNHAFMKDLVSWCPRVIPSNASSRSC